MRARRDSAPAGNRSVWQNPLSSAQVESELASDEGPFDGVGPPGSTTERATFSGPRTERF